MNTMSDAKTSCLPDNAELHVDVSDNRESVCVTRKTIRVHIHVGDNREMMSDARK